MFFTRILSENRFTPFGMCSNYGSVHVKNSHEIFFDQAFSTIYQRILLQEIAEIRSHETDLVPIDVLDDFIRLSFIPVFRRLWERTLILELNHAEKRGVLQGRTEEERFEYFSINVLTQNNLDAFYKKYPGLQSLWQEQVKLICSNVLILLERIASDFHDIICDLGGDCSALKVRKIAPIGDYHRGLQCAARIDYQTDTGFSGRVYYKPRNLNIDQGYAQFIDWWNGRSSIIHKAPRVINKGDYGWIEAINHLECAADNIHDYYRRYGSLLAFASVFGTTDLHMENVIAHGDFPVIVDLETLFSCTPDMKKDNPSYYHSYSSLLLPTHAVEDQVETSPLSASPETKTDLETMINPQRRTSSLRMEAAVFVTGKNEIEVKINGKLIDFRDYKEDIIRGCEDSLKLISQNKEEFLKIISSIFQTVRVRILFRATVEYIKILYNMGHPISLHGNSMHKDANVLCGDYYDESILSSEITQLLNGDVPYFEIDFGGNRIIDGNGDLLDIPIHHSPLRKFEHQLARNSVDVVKLITDDIEHAFCAFNVRVGANTNSASTASSPKFAPCAEADIAWFNEYANYAMDTVKEKSCRHDQIIYWRQINAMEDKAIRAGISEISLYDGLAGIALAYYIIGRRLERADFRAFATQIAQQISQQLALIPHATLGAYTGTAGTLWTLCEISQNNPIRVLKTVEAELAKLTYALVATDYQNYFQMDIISGVAGTVMMLIRLHSQFKEFPLADAIQRVAGLAYRVLKANANSLMRDNTLIGYAHGTAGVSAALANYMLYFGCADKDASHLIETNVM